MKFLDRNQITTGALWDRCVNLSGIDKHTGTIADTTDKSDFILAYCDIMDALYDPSAYNTVGFIDSGINYETQNNVAIAVMNFNINYLDSNAVIDSLFSVSNYYLYDIANRSRSPYLTYNIKYALPIYTDLYSGIVSFYFNPNYFVTNLTGTLDSLEIDFNDSNGYIKISTTTETYINHNFTTSGIKYLKIRYTINGTQYENIIEIEILESSNSLSGDIHAVDHFTNSCYDTERGTVDYDLYPSYRVNSTIINVGVTAHIFYSARSPYDCSKKKLHKPIIFLDGFDASNDRDLAKIWKDYLNVQEFGYMCEYMLNEGYDIIIVDYDDGGTYMEANALAVVDLMEKLYASHSSTMEDEFLLMGPSMGGGSSKICTCCGRESEQKPSYPYLFKL